jgi:hypothetical protein
MPAVFSAPADARLAGALQVVLAALECICMVLQATPRVFDAALDKLLPQLFLKLSDTKETVTTLAFRALTGQQHAWFLKLGSLSSQDP